MANDKDNSRGKTAAGAAATAPLATAASRLAAAQKDKFSRDFAQAIAVLMRDANCKNLRLADLEWLLLPPLMAGQCKVAVSRYRKDGPIVPVAVALWARVSAAVDKRLSENLDKPPVLRANEWTSGDNIWLITLAGEKQVLAGLLADLQKTAFKGKPAKIRAQKKDGTMVVQSVIAQPAASK